ncbi:MAG: nucleotidyl transferase AbiEii/AbiGii toxin family protein [Candidatus Melainabacteria bacterium]|nr:nucleotidyl transferase AbiEii/AbiGii toxin family protein [Candidatus Melainabacteria bacterium]
MKELLKKEMNKYTQPLFKKLALTEFLQHLVLQSLYRQNAFKYLTFTGGTALRLLYKTGRFSEDLDFSQTGKSDIKLKTLISKIQNDLLLLGIHFEAYTKDEKVVFKSDFRFPEILKELNLSPLKEQKLTIKFEVDKNPPKGGNKEILLVTSPVSYSVSVFDLPSLFATKLHAIFYRKYTKGRDYYDLIWYLGRQVKPNFKLLNNAIKQTEGNLEKIDENNFKEKLINHLETTDFKKVKDDVERLIIEHEELSFLKIESIKSLLRNY